MTRDARHSPIRNPASLLLAAIASVSGLTLYGAICFPLSVADKGKMGFLWSGIALVVYALAATWGRYASPANVQRALRVGGTAGFCLAVIAATYHGIEISIAIAPTVGAVLGGSMWGLTFLAFGIACSLTVRQEHSLRLGLLSSLWAAMTYASLLVAFGLALGFAFMPHMQQITADRYTASGMTDPGSFVVRDLLTNASSHLFIAPLVALLVGVMSAATCRLLEPMRRGLVLAWGIGTLLIFFTAVASLWFASGLPRPERPPFVTVGLGALVIALSTAHPLVTALCHPPAARE